MKSSRDDRVQNSVSGPVTCIRSAFSLCRNGRLQIWTGGLAGDNSSGYTHDRAVARHIRNDQGICADYNVITYGHAPHNLTSGSEENIITDGGPAGASDAGDADTLINRATVPDSCGGKEDATAIVYNQPRSDFALPVDVNAGEHQANRVNNEINTDHQLTKYGNLAGISPAAEPIHYHGECSQFEEWRDTLTKERLILWSHAVGADFTVYIAANGFEHED